MIEPSHSIPEPVNRPLHMDECSILNAVRRETVLDDLHEAGLGDRLQRLLKHMDQELGLDDVGKHAAFRSVAELLKSRSLMMADRERYPAIKSEVIAKPFIVTGMPRSGTTVMHSLLDADPANYAPRYWEVAWPSPPPGISAPDDPRIAHANREVAEFCRRNPLILQSHPYYDQGADALMECEPIGALDLRNVFNTYYFRLPAVMKIFLMDDPVGYFRFHRCLLQSLQWQRPPRRWALKGTQHHAYLGALRQVYPDAVLIWLHRDPYKVVPSLMEMIYLWFCAVTGESLPRPAFGRFVLGIYKDMIDAAMRLPEAGRLDTHHVLFANFMADPVGEMKRVYECNDVPFTDAAATAMKNWLRDPKNRADRHGKLDYSLDKFDMGREEVDAAFSAYRARFGIPQEQ